MTDLTFLINTKDFAKMVEKGSYTTDLIPVIGAKYTDLDKVDHTTIVRFRGTLSVVINPSSPADMKKLWDELLLAPCTVKYHSFQKNVDVEQTMIPSVEPIQDAAKRNSGHWTRKVKVTFTEE